MLTVPLIILLFAAIGVCLLVASKLKHEITAALFVKAGTSVLFILLGIWGATRPFIQVSGLENLAFFVVAGLVMGLLGDIWLDQKAVHHDHKRMYMLAGFSCFGIGHIFYFSGLFTFLGGADIALLIWPVIIGVVLVAFMYLIEKPLHMDYGEYRPVVLVYTFILTAAAVLPIILAFDPACAQPEFVFVFAAGMVLFLLSDLVLSQSYFSSENQIPERVLVPLNYLLYYGGQFTIAFSLLTIRPF